jgi:hypothetical protein
MVKEPVEPPKASGGGRGKEGDAHDRVCRSRLASEDTAARRKSASNHARGPPTYRRNDQEDDEGVEDGQDGRGEGRDDVAERLDAAEDADDAEGAHEAEDADGHVNRPERDEGHGDDEKIKHAPVPIEMGCGLRGQVR